MPPQPMPQAPPAPAPAMGGQTDADNESPNKEEDEEAAADKANVKRLDELASKLEMSVPLYYREDSTPPTLAASNFRALYDAARPANGRVYRIAELRRALANFCRACADHPRMGLDKARHEHFARTLGGNRNLNGRQLKRSLSSLAPQNALVAFAIRIWTSPRQWSGREFCSLLNQAIREDGTWDMDTLRYGVVLCRAINTVLNKGNQVARALSAWPDGPDATDAAGISDVANACFRGGGLRPSDRAFYAVGKKFRTGMFMASSFKRAVALEFMSRHGAGTRPVLWTIVLDERKCAHANLVERLTVVKGETEFLFPAYSTFTVEAADFGEQSEYHQVTLRAAQDNMEEAEDLPTAPWS